MSTPSATKELWSVSEFAGAVGCSDRQIHKLCLQGRLGTRVGGVWVMTLKDFTRYENRVDRRLSENSEKSVKHD